VFTRKRSPGKGCHSPVTTVTTNYEKTLVCVWANRGAQQKHARQEKTQELFLSSGGDTLPPSEEVSDTKASQVTPPAEPVVTAVVAAVVTPASGAHSTPSQTTGPADQDELIRNLVALVKEEPGTGPFTLAITALLKTDAVLRLLAEEGVSTPLVTSTSGRQQ